MSEENAAIDNAQNVVDLKQLEGAILAKFKELQETTEQANGEIKTMGEVNTETKAKIEDITTKYDGLYDRLQELEQKGGASSEATQEFDVGAEFVKSDAYQAVMEGKAGNARLDWTFKTAIINATGQNQPLVPSDRLGGIITTPNRDLQIRDILPASTTSSNLVEFTRENVFTNNAGPQLGSPNTVVENVTKPESGITFTLVNEPVRTLAHFIPASRQVLDDSASLQAHINGRLMYGLKLYEDDQLLNGAGSAGELNGLITQGTAATGESPAITNEIDIIRSAIKQAHVGEYTSPDFCVLNPQDWFDIDIRKVGSSDDRYVVGNPRTFGIPTLWGLPVVVTNSIASGTFLIGTSSACEIKDRQQAAVELSREDSTNFRDNMVTVLAEERLALCVYRTEAFITGSL